MLDGTLMLLDAALHALQSEEVHDLQLEQADLATECSLLAQRRLKCSSSALVNAGPSAGDKFTAPYKIWHGKRYYFLKPDFQPDAIEKKDMDAALDKTKRTGQGDKVKTEPESRQDKAKAGARREPFRGYRQPDRIRQPYRRPN